MSGLERQRAQQLYSSRSRANTLGHYAVYYNDPKLINSVWRKYEQVTKADLQRAARAYFSESNRTIVTTGRTRRGEARVARRDER